MFHGIDSNVNKINIHLWFAANVNQIDLID